MELLTHNPTQRFAAMISQRGWRTARARFLRPFRHTFQRLLLRRDLTPTAARWSGLRLQWRRLSRPSFPARPGMAPARMVVTQWLTHIHRHFAHQGVVVQRSATLHSALPGKEAMPGRDSAARAWGQTASIASMKPAFIWRRSRKLALTAQTNINEGATRARTSAQAAERTSYTITARRLTVLQHHQQIAAVRTSPVMRAAEMAGIVGVVGATSVAGTRRASGALGTTSSANSSSATGLVGATGRPGLVRAARKADVAGAAGVAHIAGVARAVGMPGVAGLAAATATAIAWPLANSIIARATQPGRAANAGAALAARPTTSVPAPAAHYRQPSLPQLVWRKQLVAASTSDATAQVNHSAAAGAAQHRARTQAALPPAAIATQLRVNQLDPALADRLATEVIRRVERSLRIERERRGL